MRIYKKNALDSIDEYITGFDDREPLEEVYRIDGYEDIGKFDTVEEATEYALNHTHLANEREFISDWIYKEVDYEWY